MATDPDDRWTRLGELLVARRVAVDPRYRNRRTFCEETGLDYRVIGDLENHRRSNFGGETLAAAENGYRLKTGAIRGYLAGGELVPADASPAAPAADEAPLPADVEEIFYRYPDLEQVWDLTLSEVERRLMIMTTADFRDRNAAARRAVREQGGRRHA